MMYPSLRRLVLALLLFPASYAVAGSPSELLLGEAPVLFTGAEGEDADGTILADGVSAIHGDDIWLWVPAIDFQGQVDLSVPGQFFLIWDSGPESGMNGNDDNANGMRGMDFDPLSGTFLVSYEDSTTTGFDFGNILDGDLMELTPTALDNGFITEFVFTRLFSECPNGDPGCIGVGDINSVSRVADGTLYYGTGGAQTILTDMGGMLDVGSSTFVHAVLTPDPRNIGPDPFFEASVAGCPIIFCPGVYTGQLRGADLLVSGDLTFGTSGDYRNQAPSGNDVVVVGEKADILWLPGLITGMTTLEQRTAEVLYSGALFFEEPNVGDAEILDHDILDSAGEISALITLLGSSSDAGIALAPFVGDAEFIRGDADGQGGFNGLLDGLYVLNFAFLPGSPAPPCMDAADSDDDGVINGLTDGLRILNFQFLPGTPPPPPPGAVQCGVDPTPDSLDCAVPGNSCP